jgi:hypothetical protein
MSEETQDIIKDAKEELRNRFKSPFIGSFMISWVVFNSKLILFIILSKKTIEHKFKHIDDYSNLCSMLAYPLLSALFYTAFNLLLLPWLQTKINKITSNSKKILKTQKQEIDNVSKISELEEKITSIELLNIKINSENIEQKKMILDLNSELNLFKELNDKYQIEFEELKDAHLIKETELERKISNLYSLLFMYSKNLRDSDAFKINYEILLKNNISKEILKQVRTALKINDGKLDKFNDIEDVLLKLNIIAKYGNDDYELNDDVYKFYFDFLGRN